MQILLSRLATLAPIRPISLLWFRMKHSRKNRAVKLRHSVLMTSRKNLDTTAPQLDSVPTFTLYVPIMPVLWGFFKLVLHKPLSKNINYFMISDFFGNCLAHCPWWPILMYTCCSQLIGKITLQWRRDICRDAAVARGSQDPGGAVEPTFEI